MTRLYHIYSKLKKERLLLSVIIVVWLFLFMTTISKTYLFYVRQGLELNMGYIILRALLIWGGLLLFVPFVIFLAKKFPLAEKVYQNAGMHLFCSILIIPAHAIFFRTVIMIMYRDVGWSLASFLESVPIIMSWLGIIDPFAYWLTIAAYSFKKYYERYRDRQIQHAHLEAELASMRLHILKVQLHPHFLFNTLHNINSLIYEAPAKAQRVLMLLKQFLETSIARVDDQKVPLRDELEFTNTYLEIEKTRYSDRLHIKTEIDQHILDELVPSFLLQPLVENAVKHGISQKMEPSMIKITAQKKGSMLNITVEDDGAGLKNTEFETGIGLKNIKQRLNQLYQDPTFKLVDSTLGGLKVYIEIPAMT